LEEVNYKRQKSKFCSDNYEQYEQSTTWQTELAKIIEKNIPVDCFAVYNSSKRGAVCEKQFEDISKETGGEMFPAFEVELEHGQELLIGHITKQILLYVGGEGNGNELVNAYTQKFGKMHA